MYDSSSTGADARLKPDVFAAGMVADLETSALFSAVLVGDYAAGRLDLGR